MQKLKKKLYEQTTCLFNEESRIDVFKKQRNYYDFLNNNSEHFINFVKTGEAKSQAALEIESFIKKHIFVQAIHYPGIGMINIVVMNGNWEKSSWHYVSSF